jgi:diguanylate cyclase (GGDEF)-like protein
MPSAPPPPPEPGPQTAALPFNEAERLNVLRNYGVLDTGPEQAFDDLTTLASAVCQAPMALITLVDEDRQWFKAREGVDLAETPREISFCAHTILQPDRLMEVADTRQDPRFAHNPLVTGDTAIRFYAGAPLVTPQGVAIGTVCVLDHRPRNLTGTERRALHSLARQVVAQLELRQAVAGLELQGMTDSLTSAWNRRAFDRRLREEWQRHRQDGRPLGLLMVDLDFFKRINDDFGHPAGDAVLVQVAGLLQASVRRSDLVARFGGEEFAVVLPDADIAAARAVAEKVRRAIEQAAWPNRPLTASIGVASVVPAAGSDGPALVAAADKALYRAKQAGRNRVQVFEGWD